MCKFSIDNTVWMAAGAAEGTENIFLLEICLWFGSLVIFLNTLDSLARVALLIAVRHVVRQFSDRFLVLVVSPQN